MRILILGAGKMGSFFTDILSFQHETAVFDVNPHTIGNAKPETVYIEGSIQGMPIVKDKSGNGNNAYIHGQPEFGTDDKGKQTLVLDGKRDYIEIPDNGGYTPKDAMTGMVWANLPSAGTTKGGVSELTEQYVDLDVNFKMFLAFRKPESQITQPGIKYRKSMLQ